MSDEPPATHELTRLVLAAREDRGEALAALYPLLQDDLRRLAGARMRRERPDHTLQPTALVHEAYARIANQPGLEWRDRVQFLAVAAHAMRQVLVDHARGRRALKRGGDRARVTLDEGLTPTDDRDLDVLDLHDQLEALAGLHARRAQVVELRFFGGLTHEEAAQALGVSPKTVEADWAFSRAWLRRALKRGGAG